MNHSDFPVELLNTSGQVVGSKARRDIDKLNDIFSVVHILVFSPTKELFLSLIPERKDLPNLYAGKLGTTAASIKRLGESSEEAVLRVLRKELSIETKKVDLLGQIMARFPNGAQRLLTTYCITYPDTPNFNTEDIQSLKLFTREQLEKELERKDTFSHSLLSIWDAYKNQLPF